MRRAAHSLSVTGEADPGAEDVAARGAVFTRPEVVAALLDLADYTVEQPLHTWRLLEPSFGGGDILLAAVERLLASFTAAGGTPRTARSLRAAVRAVELHAVSFASTRGALHARLLTWGATTGLAALLCDAWLVHGDFLLAPLTGDFTVVVGNPPYVRQERIPGPLLSEYRRRYATIYDRADLYVPFFERGLQLLADDGRLAFICADRWQKNRYGGPLRAMVAGGFHLSHHVDMATSAAFKVEVMAYPAITVIRRGLGAATRVARCGELRELPGLIRAMTTLGPLDDPRIDVVADMVRGDRPWLFDARDHLDVLRRLERDFPELADVGCKVGIGVATGADSVFVGDHEALPVEATRKLPLVMAGDLDGGAVVWRGFGIVNPFEADGSLAALERYPAFAAYMRAHEVRLRQRHVARRSGDWYRTIDRVYAELTTTHKLLIPDIRGEAVVVYDEGRYYPHHNLYHVTASDWELPALATILRSSVALLFVSSYCAKISGGFLRFQAQYLRRIRVPRWEAVAPAIRAALVAADPRDRAAIDEASFAAYGLGVAEANTTRAAATAARRGRSSA